MKVAKLRCVTSPGKANICLNCLPRGSLGIFIDPKSVGRNILRFDTFLKIAKTETCLGERVIQETESEQLCESQRVNTLNIRFMIKPREQKIIIITKSIKLT